MLFGGFDSRSLNDSWEYDGNDWVQLIASAMPPPRYGHRLIYNSNLQQIVMFGGRQDATVFSDDTWEYDGSTWMQALPAAKPQPRAHHGLAYDSDRDRVVMFGGWDGWDGTPRFDDTWEYWSTAADLVVTMVDSPDPVTMGQNLTYALTITNNGPITATSVIV